MLTESEHMRIDVELAYTVCMLRKRERELAQRAQDLKVSSVYPFQTLPANLARTSQIPTSIIHPRCLI